MLAVVVAIATSAVTFGPPIPWANGFAGSPRIALAGDLQGRGFTDLVAVFPQGDCIIDVKPSVGGMKGGSQFQGLTGWGKDCQAAAIGEVDDVPGDDVVGVFQGKQLRLAGAFHDGHFQDVAQWAQVPKQLMHPLVAVLAHRRGVLVWSQDDGEGFLIDPKTKAATEKRLPRSIVWLGDEGDRLVVQHADGHLCWLDRDTLREGSKLGAESRGSRPAAADGIVAFGDQVWTPAGSTQLSADSLPKADKVLMIGPDSNGSRKCLVEYRCGSEPHTGNEVLVRRTDDNPLFRSTANDGLLDDWKLHGFRGLDLPGMGCSPDHADVICLVSRFDDVPQKRVEEGMKRIIDFYSKLKVPNPDGKPGIRFHPVYLDQITGTDKTSSWWTNRDKFLPKKWRGVVHWMQITPGGGGQADELSDGGTCGEGALWAVFVHEFGHQLGLNHEGFMTVGASPVYTSLMNYTYSYHFEDDVNLIHYSDGSLAKLVLHADDLDETLPFPYDRVKFLEKGPYHFRLKANGSTTLIDWNWNGLFGEKHVRADINYAYSTSAGVRDTVAKTKTAPWLLTHDGRAFALYGTNDLPADPKVDPTLSPDRPGRLILRRLVKPNQWDPEWVLESGGLTGDPVAASFDGKIVIVYPSSNGIAARRVTVGRSSVQETLPEPVDPDRSLVPSVAVLEGRLYAFLWNPNTKEQAYRILGRDGKWSSKAVLPILSTNPVGACWDPLAHEAVLGMAQDQDKGRTNRWQIRRFTLSSSGELTQGKPPEWVEGAGGGARGTGRLALLFDASKAAGQKGRVYLFGKGITSKESPWACAFVAHQIADKAVKGGWLVKRYYDEWSQTRSAPAAAWFGGDVIYAYRWVDGAQGETDNNFHLGYRGLGIQIGAMTDFDDLSFIRNFGLANSLLSLGDVNP